MTTALITGITGFVGKHLSDHLSGLGWNVYGFDQRIVSDAKHIFVGDLANRDAMQGALQACHPDVVYHLAGQIKSSEPDRLYQANLSGTVSLFESLLATGQKPVIVLASSSAVYGSGFDGRPISETFKPRPVTHYAVSKLAQEIAALRYFDALGWHVVVGRIFNLLGPGQSPDLACSAFARQIALAERDQLDEIITGDLSARRDFVDVRDAVRALAALAEKGKAGQVYNICSGRAVLMRKCLGEMLSMSPRTLQARVDAGRVQKNDVPIQVGSARKLNKLTGWRPQISLKRSLSDLLEYWRQRVQSGTE